jgi:hypothetical protein
MINKSLDSPGNPLTTDPFESLVTAFHIEHDGLRRLIRIGSRVCW